MFNKFQLGTQSADFLARTKLDNCSSLVLIKFLCHVNKSNMVVGTPADIAKRSGITIGDFTVGIRGLKKCDMVRKYTKKEYMLNPDIMFNGDDKRYYVIKNMWDTQTSKGLRT
jgi:hypothetical protein